jgi:hypothetical protein
MCCKNKHSYRVSLTLCVTLKLNPMRTEYATEVLQTIDNQEFYNDVIDFINTEVFDDILDFMHIYNPNWYKNLGTWASEFIQRHIACYIDLYDDNDLSMVDLLASLYWDLDKQYQEFATEYKMVTAEIEAFRYGSNIDEDQ